MVRKLAKKKTISAKKKSKKTTDANNNFGSSGVLVLGIIGIIILIVLALPKNNELDKPNDETTEIEEKSQDKNINKELIIDGLIYPSKAYALAVLKDKPQTQLSDEEWEFLMDPDGYSK